MHPPDAHRLGELLTAGLEPDPVTAPAPGDRLAAVLLLVIDGLKPSLVFTRRTEELPRHAGEISFPGGLAEPGDADLGATALRESREELGIDPVGVELLGALPPIHTVVSSILVAPFVGLLPERPAMRPDPSEIAEVLEFPLARLAEVESTMELSRVDDPTLGWAYELDGHMIWGATGFMLHAFLDVVRSRAPSVLAGASA